MVRLPGIKSAGNADSFQYSPMERDGGVMQIFDTGEFRAHRGGDTIDADQQELIERGGCRETELA